MRYAARCPHCEKVKRLSEFATRADGCTGWCKACDRKRRAATYNRYHDRELEKQAEYYQAHKAERQAYGRAYGKWRRGTGPKPAPLT